MYEEERKWFKRYHGYEPDFKNPKTYNEKICYRKLFDRNPLLITTSDKYKARQYIKNKIGYEAENHFIPLLWATDNPETIPFDDLPDEYVIKPNNGAGWWIIKDLVQFTVDSTKKIYDSLTKEQIINICKGWLSEDYSKRWNEWAYGQIDPLIVVEKLLRCKNGELPSDYRLCMFSGKLRLIYVTKPYQAMFNYFDQDWNPIKFKYKPLDPDCKRPVEFDKMIYFAEKLSKGWNFIRCDFYLVDGKVYFGELTHYPGCGHTPFPRDIDLKLGEYWK